MRAGRPIMSSSTVAAGYRPCKDGFKNAVERAAKVCATLGRYETHPTTGEQVFETDVTPHVIRHTVVTWLDERNVASKRTAQLVGHADERTTKRVYTHAAVEVLREAVDVLDEPFAPLPRIALTEVNSGEQQGATQPIVSQRDTNGALDRPQIEAEEGDLSD